MVAGGGTAGHLFPVLAVARALVRRGHEPATIELVASRRGGEGEVLAESGFPHVLLPGRGLRRSAAPADLAVNLRAVADLGRAAWSALRLMRAWRPAVVVTVGGYASAPAGLAAVVLGIPLVLVNTDAVPGLAHRLLARWASASAVAFPATPLPHAVVTGTPVRPEMAEVRRDSAGRETARRALGIPEGRDVVAVVGGSLGAQRLNEAVADAARRWRDRKDLAVHHVVGRRNWEAPMGAPPDSDGLWYRRVPFEEQMATLYQAADLVVARAGAMTVGELALAGVPALLVPLPGAPRDHQTANARVLVEAGAAELLADPDCTGERLSERVQALLDDPARRGAMAAATSGLARGDAADRVAEVVTASAR